MTTQVEAPQHHPVVVEHKASRSANLQLRIADGITAFAGSMGFVYLHAALFAVWMLVVETEPLAHTDAGRVPRGDLPVHVRDDRPEPSGRLPAGEGRPRLREQELELKTNTELTRAIHALTQELHRRLVEEPGERRPQA